MQLKLRLPPRYKLPSAFVLNYYGDEGRDLGVPPDIDCSHLIFAENEYIEQMTFGYSDERGIESVQIRANQGSSIVLGQPRTHAGDHEVGGAGNDEFATSDTRL